MYCVIVNDFKQWRKQARELLKRQVPPSAIAWQAEQQPSLLTDNLTDDFLSLKIICPTPTIPNDFFHLAQAVACYRDDSRWSLLYSVAWRLIFEDRQLLGDKIDHQVARLLAMRKSVGRDKHKMEAFVRFQLLQIASFDKDSLEQMDEHTNLQTEEEYFVAWFEPEHLILPLVTPFFVKRFHGMNWSILTPDACLHWNQKQTLVTAGTSRPTNIEDGLEDLWREYYANIFNPARLKLKAMQSEMPKKYWVNLPEAPLIAELTRSAGKRTDTMINEDASQAWRKTVKSRYIKNKQKQLRSLDAE